MRAPVLFFAASVALSGVVHAEDNPPAEGAAVTTAPVAAPSTPTWEQLLAALPGKRMSYVTDNSALCNGSTTPTGRPSSRNRRSLAASTARRSTRRHAGPWPTTANIASTWIGPRTAAVPRTGAAKFCSTPAVPPCSNPKGNKARP